MAAQMMSEAIEAQQCALSRLVGVSGTLLQLIAVKGMS